MVEMALSGMRWRRADTRDSGFDEQMDDDEWVFPYYQSMITDALFFRTTKGESSSEGSASVSMKRLGISRSSAISRRSRMSRKSQTRY